jgi:mono/diheme cytochrome c family protein
MHRGLPVIFLAVLFSVSPNHASQDDEKPPTPLRPGLIATYRDAGAKPLEVTSIEPIIALALKPGEAPHPRLTPDNFTIRWNGQLKIVRPAEYTFAVGVQGKFRLTLDGKEVVTEARPQLSVRLEPGNHALIAEFTRLPGPAQVRLFWQAKHFFPEPIPHDVLGHLPEQELPREAKDNVIEQGRFLAEEHSCTACHQPRQDDLVAQGLKNRQGPDLSRVGERVLPSWFADWLRDPKKLEAHAVMPRLFAAGPAGDAEAFAVAAYLTSLSGPLKAAPDRGNANELRTSIARGERLFITIGCVVCHAPETKVYPLGTHLGSKTTISQLSRFLQNPLDTHPAGRMPNMLLNDREATDLARYLTRESAPKDAQPRPARKLAEDAFARVDPRPAERTAFAKLPDDKAWLSLGERLTLEKRCNACHKIEPCGKPFAQLRADADFDKIKEPNLQRGGCLAEQPMGADVPQFGFTPDQRRALQAFLTQETSGRNSRAPPHDVRVALQRFQCLACHQRDGQGGLTSELTDQLRKFESAENAEAVSPPPLTGTGAKLTTSWLRKVLVEGGRARPWMGLRMPHFGAANVGHLPEALAACDGIDDSRAAPAALNSISPTHVEADVNAGKLLVGKKAFGCIGCHDIAGVPSSGTRGPDLASMNQRVRYDWYRRWLVQPQKMQPGTRMPTVFQEGRTLLDEVLQGSATKQADAMWSYLALGPTLPLPEGLDPPKGLVLTVKDRPVILRTFMPDAGSKAIAVGYPQQVSMAYDAAECRVAYAWSGNFLNAGPVWNDRGGNPAKVLGTRFWEAPRGFPWFFTQLNDSPDVAGQTANPAFGASPPEGRAYTGLVRLHNTGYRTNPSDGSPVFTSEVTLEDGSTARLEETAAPLRSEAGVGLRRTFKLSVPARHIGWLLIGEANEVKYLDGEERIAKAEGSDRPTEIGSQHIILPGTGGRPTLTVIGETPIGSNVYVIKRGNTTYALLRVQPSDAPVVVTHWQPYRDDIELLRKLARTR